MDVLSPWTCLLWTLHINAIIQHAAFCAWLFSLNTASSRVICVVACLNISWGFVAEHQSTVRIHYILSPHPSGDGHPYGFHILAMIKNAAMNYLCPTFTRTCVSLALGYIRRSGIAGSRASSLEGLPG